MQQLTVHALLLLSSEPLAVCASILLASFIAVTKKKFAKFTKRVLHRAPRLYSLAHVVWYAVHAVHVDVLVGAFLDEYFVGVHFPGPLRDIVHDYFGYGTLHCIVALY